MATRTVLVPRLAAPLPPSLEIGDTVELRESATDTIGTVVAIVRPDHVKVEWSIGPGYMGKTIMLSVRALRKRSADN